MGELRTAIEARISEIEKGLDMMFMIVYLRDKVSAELMARGLKR